MHQFGVLGHGEADFPLRVPRQIMSLNRRKIVAVAVGSYHVCCIDSDRKTYSWGRNNKGQCGRGFESDRILEPGTIDIFNLSQYPIAISSGQVNNQFNCRVAFRTCTQKIFESNR